jgi:hypothetical protein
MTMATINALSAYARNLRYKVKPNQKEPLTNILANLRLIEREGTPWVIELRGYLERLIASSDAEMRPHFEHMLELMQNDGHMHSVQPG